MFQVVFISTPPGQDVPGDKTGNFHMEITLPISNSEIPDLRGVKELGHPLHPVFLQSQGTPYFLHTLEPFFLPLQSVNSHQRFFLDTVARNPSNSEDLSKGEREREQKRGEKESGRWGLHEKD